jgi:alpha-D-ribose 1-methylphosphonate 5-triphosphate synthase subunit PhnH
MRRVIHNIIMSVVADGPGKKLPKSLEAAALEHDPEKWMPVFGKDHAPPKG